MSLLSKRSVAILAPSGGLHEWLTSDEFSTVAEVKHGWSKGCPRCARMAELPVNPFSNMERDTCI